MWSRCGGASAFQLDDISCRSQETIEGSGARRQLKRTEHEDQVGFDFTIQFVRTCVDLSCHVCFVTRWVHDKLFALRCVQAGSQPSALTLNEIERGGRVLFCALSSLCFASKEKRVHTS